MIEQHAEIAKIMRARRRASKIEWPSGGIIFDSETVWPKAWGKMSSAAGAFYRHTSTTTTSPWVIAAPHTSHVHTKVTSWGGEITREDSEPEPSHPAIKKPAKTPPMWAVDIDKKGAHKHKKKR
ncbi:hypothetical protein PP304_gp146 [Gordonia phage Phendrix]|uniref:Uncharacterized protein n=1 Tax=Gordonia phage Phendrix TaxID=2593335 RepID=A0A514U191_9CAUD|nr:hypothetical protein PP304_gp146 [Gordonia phage Phendrix]QDK02723.1 hypothetical protein SEA_PHENDRIX_207 [Gordonia phage Phendrix]